MEGKYRGEDCTEMITYCSSMRQGTEAGVMYGEGQGVVDMLSTSELISPNSLRVLSVTIMESRAILSESCSSIICKKNLLSWGELLLNDIRQSTPRIFLTL